MNAKRVARDTFLLLALANLHCSADNGASEPSQNGQNTGTGAGGTAPGAGGVAPGTGGAPPGAGGAGAVGGGGGVAGSGAVAGGGGVAGAGATAGAGGVAGVGGTAGAGGSGGFMPGGPNTAPGYQNLAPPMLSPLDASGATALNPPAPAGWNWFPIEGTQCRDGSQAGMFVRFTDSDKLFIYFEGGGACSNGGFCNFNPPSVNHVLSGTGETVLGSALGTVPGRQQPGVYEAGVLNGIYDDANPENPFQGWNGVYIPYCTGDVHFGTKTNGTVPGLAAPQQFVGHLNAQKFIGHLVPTFKDRVDYVVATGSSAGSFGAALNSSMIQDAFGDNARIDLLLDSGLPFTNDYMPECMQARWREAWGLNAALPPDCEGCFDPGGGNLLKLSDFLLAKHPNSRLAFVTAEQDEVIRLFFSVGLVNCMNYDTADPVAITLLQADPTVYYPGPDYQAAVYEMKDLYVGSGRLASYILAGAMHQHLWRGRFYTPAAGGVTIADFVQGFVDGNVQQVAP